MKSSIILKIVAILLIAGCTNDSLIISDPSPEEIQRIAPSGQQITQELLLALKSELQSAISEGGFGKAIGICNLKAIPVSKMVEQSSSKIIWLKRTTYQYRNPLNAPDEIEKQALNYFQNLVAMNEVLPESYIQKISNSDSTYYYYFKPLKMDVLCMGCHGKTENIDPAVLTQIKELYPDDKATGYAEGDFRGLVSVIIRE